MSKLFEMFNGEDNDKEEGSKESSKNSSSESNLKSFDENRKDNSSEKDDKKLDKESGRNNSEDGVLQLHKEELNINKSTIHAGDVELSKEIVEEKKALDIPVTREEVVIERHPINKEVSDFSIGNVETIRIPVNEEKIEVQKRIIVTEEISAHKRQVEKTEHVEEILKSEEARVTKVGNPNLVSKEGSHTPEE